MHIRSLSVLAGIACLTLPTNRAAQPARPEAPTGAIRPAGLRCEGRLNPIGIDARSPRLGWTLESSERDQRQSAYQVLVASEPSRLVEGGADLWDSGRVASDESAHVAYGGQPLSSAQTVHWRVRVWDRAGRASDWSEAATWTTGLLDPTDWRAAWITTPAELSRKGPLDGGLWIWSPDVEWFPEPVGPVAAGATRYFLRTLELPAAPTSAEIAITADNVYRLYVNGQHVATDDDWYHAETHDVTSRLHEGLNTIAAKVTNAGTASSPAGLLARMRIALPGGSAVEIATDKEWLVTEDDDAWANGAPKASAAWRPARALAPAGVPPWHELNPGVQRGPLPVFRHRFAARAGIRRALLFVCGLGHHEVYLNGRRVGDHFLDPPWSMYGKTAFYATHDVTQHLRPGANALGVLLGKGWYATAGDRRIHGISIDRPLMLIAQLHIEYADGSRDAIGSDESWRWTDGPLLHDSILGGCDFDARRLSPGWSEPDFDDSAWPPVVRSAGPGGELVTAASPPLRVMQELPPLRIDQPEPGVFVYDFGQNASATPRLRVRGKAGQTLRLTYAEQRHGQTEGRNNGRGRVNQAGIGSPAYIEYRLRGGGEEEWSPPFFYSGYQYVELTGAVPEEFPNPTGLPVVRELQSLHVRSSAEPAGTFECSNELFNRIDRLVDWSVRSNLLHVLTDCPHREKLGWLEVPYLMWNSIAFRYNLDAFAPKIARDMRDSQGPRGEIYTVAPSYPYFNGGYRYTPEWGAAGVFVPWYAYEWYGDRRVLEDNFEMMRRFVDFMRDTSRDLVPLAGLGDWYDYGHGKPLGPSQFTPPELTAMATFKMGADVVSRAAGVLGRRDEAARYAELAGRIAARFNELYFDGRDEYRNFGSPQTANAIALCAGIAPQEHVAAVVERIVADVRARGNQQTAGDVGYRYLIRALADHGRSDVLFDINSRREPGSYAHMLERGWTSLPESWNVDLGVSLNHCMLGHVQEWFQLFVGGVRPDEPGFKSFVVRPEPVGDLTWARVTHRSPYGAIACRWERDAHAFTLEVTVPVNTAARVFLPAPEGAVVTEGSAPAERAAGVAFVGRKGDRAVYGIGSGTYRFRVSPP